MSDATTVTADDVIASIEMILGRTPSQELVNYHLGLGFKSRFDLGRYMLGTDEFNSKFSWTKRLPIFLGDRVLAYTHRGQMIYLAPSDVDLTPGILQSGTFEPHVENTIMRFVKPGATVVDLGSNVGYHTLAIASTVGDHGQVHAFEANPEVMKLLKATMVVNRFSSFSGIGRVNLYNNAVMDNAGSITLAMAPWHFGSGHAINQRTGEEYSVRVNVPAVTLDSVLVGKVGAVDLIHMDIEGSELLPLLAQKKSSPVPLISKL